ncbi:unnamed protein product [Caenorhabditis auriculariae]|uniref:Phosphate transporter n=1 Tax=Caenorhabditis auriculariae TaxID=2777116 RepID=A0A8S1GT93_9PELO|nr:unnamed protein product [Caenorhabditis auriculariae]
MTQAPFGDYILELASLDVTTERYKPIPHFNVKAVEWALLFGMSFLLGIGMGANDIADAFGTSVGTHTVTINQAFILATLFELVGSLIAGLNNTLMASLDIINFPLYFDHPDELILGQVASIIGCTTWLMVATAYKMPVSTIHATVGGNIGFSLVLRGFNGILWTRVAAISMVWIFSPIVSGLFSILVFYIIDFTVLRRKNPLKAASNLLPAFYFVTFFIAIALVISDGSRIVGFQNIPVDMVMLISIAAGGTFGLFALFIVEPFMRQRIGSLKGFLAWFRTSQEKDDEDAVRLFAFLQVAVACFSAFSYGANDIMFSISPLYELLRMYNQEELNSGYLDTTVLLGMFATLAVIIGIWSIGTRVIHTVGQGISEINPATGFAVEFGAAFTGMFTNIFNAPQSNTHSLVGSLVLLGFVRSGPVIHWKMVRKVMISWILTFPFSGLISAGVMLLFQAYRDATFSK